MHRQALRTPVSDEFRRVARRAGRLRQGDGGGHHALVMLIRQGALPGAVGAAQDTADSRRINHEDPVVGGALFPKDSAKNTRFTINFFTSISMGGVTESARKCLVDNTS